MGGVTARGLASHIYISKGIKMSMGYIRFFLSAIALSNLLTGCSIGNGRICGPQTPRAYCDREAYQKLLHPTPLSDYWSKADSSPEKRRQDWVGCGGSPAGWFDVQIDEASGANYNEKSREYSHNIQRCMIKKGYHYTGQCDSSVMKVAPACTVQ